MSAFRNLESERAVLGCLVLDNTLGAEVLALVTADDFDPKHRPVFVAICRAVDSRSAFDELSLVADLRARGELDFVGGPAFVASLVDTMPTTVKWRSHALRVRVAGMLRRLSDAASGVAMECAEAAIDSDESALTWFSNAQKRLVEASTFGGGARNLTSGEVVRDVLKYAQERHENRGQMLGWTTGFPGIDDKLLGLRRKRLHVVAAKTGVGKTAFALNVLWHSAAAGAKCYVVSLEMGVEELGLRLVSAASGVPGLRVECGTLEEADWPRLANGVGRISELPITWPESPPTTLAGIRAECQALKRKQGLDVLVVDYLQLVHSDRGGESREQQVSAISRGLKLLATELDIAVVALSQLNRKQDRHVEPQLADLRDSGAIEQDANSVLFLWTESDELTAPVRWKLAKNRGGFLGDGQLVFKRAIQRFVESS